MSDENSEVIARANDAFNRPDIDAFKARLDPEVEWEESGDVLPGLRGPTVGAPRCKGASRNFWNPGRASTVGSKS
jgi:hypothetical protein